MQTARIGPNLNSWITEYNTEPGQMAFNDLQESGHEHTSNTPQKMTILKWFGVFKLQLLQ